MWCYQLDANKVIGIGVEICKTSGWGCFHNVAVTCEGSGVIFSGELLLAYTLLWLPYNREFLLCSSRVVWWL
jgi:hypothetical protein